ncbi:MAG TPA: hypothetical protein VHC86_11990, partial [Opitutaceae bacterium]|nr:hypothetical protein [Opitutaceae bacterium]
RRLAAGLLGLGAAVALAGPWRLRWRDDIRDLQVPAPGLEANDRALRALFGDGGEHAVYITQGPSAAEAREALGRFLAWHAARFPGISVASAGELLPSPADWRAAQGGAGMEGFAGELRAALARHHFDPGAFAPFFADFGAWRGRAPASGYGAFVRDFAARLEGPAALAIGSQPAATWFVSVAGGPESADPPASTATVNARELESLNRLFVRYRHSALRLSLLGLVLVGLSVLAIYGVRQGLAIFAIPSGSCLFAFGLLGLLGHPINLFHLLGAFLGVCLAHNYAIFTWENAARGEVPPPSIRLSAACTIASFGILGTSGIPVVAALGTTVALVVATALAAVELVPLARRRSLAAA